MHVLAGATCALRQGAIDVLQLEWNRRKLRQSVPACVTLRRVALLLERFGYDVYLVGRPYVPLTRGYWHEAYEAAKLPCPPYCTGDVVALRRGWAAREAVASELMAFPVKGPVVKGPSIKGPLTTKGLPHKGLPPRASPFGGRGAAIITAF